ncbi:MAG: hypothetical protein J6S67_19420 [Methanobrevibacter sp.]|nr:hypothetical protein [Methanobrevibacter sp.]
MDKDRKMDNELFEGSPKETMKKIVRAWKKSRKDEGYEDTPGYKFIKTKQVMDQNGFYTDYTWYKRESDGLNVFVFGDNELYLPQDEYWDWEEESDEHAEEWFNSYEGFEEEDTFSFDDDLDEAKKHKDWVIDDPYGQDSGYFTREDLTEFAYAVLDILNKDSSDYEYLYSYVDGDILDCGFERDGYELSATARIDMRKIRLPKDLNKYAQEIADKIVAEYNDATR